MSLTYKTSNAADVLKKVVDGSYWFVTRHVRVATCKLLDEYATYRRRILELENELTAERARANCLKDANTILRAKLEEEKSLRLKQLSESEGKVKYWCEMSKSWETRYSVLLSVVEKIEEYIRSIR